MLKSIEDPPLLTVVTPAFCEAKNLPILLDRLRTLLDADGVRWEWIVVDDHSTDDTPAVLGELMPTERRLKVIRLARNHGSYTAIACGLRYARGEAAVVLSADLQDPPEVISSLLSRWRAGAQVVWAARRERSGDAAVQRLTSGLFHRLIRRMGGLGRLPASGADFFLLDRRVLDALGECHERSVNLTALISWMGFRQEHVLYDRGARMHGRSGWSLERKIKYALDSLTAFSYLPIRLMSYAGVLIAMCGFVGALYVFVCALGGGAVRGYPSLMVAILVLGGLQMVMLGVLGEYLWRTYDEVRGRPRFLIEQTHNLSTSAREIDLPSAIRSVGPIESIPISSGGEKLAERRLTGVGRAG